ncbi:hypothetical protein SAMN05660653_02722 [Desulfonatronum thiosulfatophilum]|uniref:EpsG family protein n=1 Tax=Desulfonatronum thiosulfatophilum TaxID=617002 RepID=A0A1G6EBU1_9BACT|nr:hypothetical protein SAMN05660653_02722 [Desulfonatronum thiosulfatophilum]
MPIFRISISLSIMYSLSIIFGVFHYVYLLFLDGSFVGDIGIYYKYFISFSSINISGVFALNNDYILFNIFFWILAQLLSFEFALSIFVVIFYFTASIFFYQISKMKFISCFVLFLSYFFFVFESLSTLVIRQGLAVSFLFFFGFYYKKTSLPIDFLKIFIAAFIHIIAIFYFPVIFMMRLINLNGIIFSCLN